MVFNTGPYTVLPDNSILIAANMQSETGFPSSHQLKSYVASKSRLKLVARAVLSADASLLVYFVLGIAPNPHWWTDFDDDLYVITCFRTRKCLLGVAMRRLPI